MNDIYAILVFVLFAGGIIYLKLRFPTIFLTPSSDDEYDPGVILPLQGKNAEIEQILETEMYFFRTLTDEQKKEFIKRVLRFNYSTWFYPQNGFKLEIRHVVLISATFVQITFGLRISVLDHLNRIKIFPAHYLDPRTKRQYKGEVDINGMICLSWEDFEIGLRDSTDGRNVGLHELAHAFAIEIIEKDTHYSDLLMTLKPVFLRAKAEIIHPEHRHNLLREYGYSNMHEYFAVSSELFFERPDYLANSGSPLYKELCDVYHQNPFEQYQAYEMRKASENKA